MTVSLVRSRETALSWLRKSAARPLAIVVDGVFHTEEIVVKADVDQAASHRHVSPSIRFWATVR